MLKTILTVFGLIFLAEMGDKTQLATFAYAASCKQKFAVFLGASFALIITSFIGAYLGGMIGKLLPYRYVNTGVGLLFIGIGLFMVFKG
ncbi:MAG: hypothetical protein AMJ45_06435 [Syntrophobacter sp. DG_60]|nr:MAG: hypothetical protein AMJ45_06435 [Syntrophobacter sp. DG_60]